MRALTAVELGIAVDSISERIPGLVLDYVGQFPGCRWERPLYAIEAMTAPPLEPDDARALVEDAIHWYLRRSDLYIARGRRLWPMPPSLIWYENGEELRATVAGAVNAQGLVDMSSSTHVEVHQARVSRIEGSGAIGLYHWLTVTPFEVDQVRRMAADIGFENVDVETLFRELPRVADLLRPAIGHVAASDIPSSRWEAYESGEGWAPIERTASKTSILIRSVTELEGKWSFRHFAKASDGTLLEIGWEEASLWKYLKDAESDHTNALVENEILLVEHRLPPTTALWMTGLGCVPWGYDKTIRLFGYQIPGRIKDRVLTQLNETLRMNITNGR